MAFKCDIPAVATLQSENENVRITRWDFAPGAVTGWHEHGWPYFVVMITDGVMRVHDGEKVVDVPWKAGAAYQRPAGIRHDVMNGGARPMSFVEIEIKRSEAFAFAAQI
ncbi:cupin domain-containing protein [Zavarzinia aquatilis]|uniref:Cupin n=1 Tax=Zavarzinia aquatilis TaxID=2211142 RepID=A0A317DX34_9PROT|nr:cupin domain-containing protein [Zavarzinia aquatilis]PWR19307.1 cupin [Zavarzinia aquatilis]